MGKLQSRIRDWWTSNPMVYDWKKTLKVQEGTRDFFNEIDQRFFTAAFFAQEKGRDPFSKLIDYYKLEGKKVLEIGCGAGALAAIFSKYNTSITAIDLTLTAVKYTKRRFGMYGLKGNILQMDAESMGFEDESFDFVWSWGVIHHSENTEQIISEIYRVLKPGGKVAIMVYNKSSIYFWIYLFLIRGVFYAKLLSHSMQEVANLYSDGLIAKYYTPAQFTAMFAKYKFSKIKTQIYGQKVDVYPSPAPLRSWVIKFIPGSITNWLTYNFGRFLYLTAIKPKYNA